MSDFQSALLDLNEARLESFGETVSYQVPGTDAPSSIMAVRGNRTADENEQLAAFERIWTRAGQFAAPPAKGDFVTLGMEGYVVFQTKPDAASSSDGITLYLNRRLSV